MQSAEPEHWLRQTLRLSTSDKADAIAITFWLVSYRCFAIFRGLDSLISPLQLRSDAATSPHSVTTDTLTAALRLGDLCARVARHLPFHCSCLLIAVTCSRVLCRHSGTGCQHEIVLGARTDAPDTEHHFAAHAWVKVADVVVCGKDVAEEYQPLASFRLKRASRQS